LCNFWLTKANKLFPHLTVAAKKLLSAHATSCIAERDWSALGSIYTSLHNSLGIKTAVNANMLGGVTARQQVVGLGLQQWVTGTSLNNSTEAMGSAMGSAWPN